MAKKKDSVVMQEQDLQQVSAQQRVVQIAVKAFTYLFLGVMALIVLFPFYWMIISSLKDLAEYRLCRYRFHHPEPGDHGSVRLCLCPAGVQG